MGDVNGDWTEVSRRKNNGRFQANNELTTFYVTGFPDGTRKEELRDPFSRFGKVVDVYFGWKKNAQGRNYAFVRFLDVKDCKELEAKLQGIRCKQVTLETNISKHQRKAAHNLGVSNGNIPVGSARKQSRTFGIPPQGLKVRDNRTFAQVISGLDVGKSMQPSPPITLNPNTHMNEWLKKRVLIGEAHSLDHIGTMHASGIVKEVTKYLGGLRLAIEFQNSTTASEFLGDESRWKDWFKWLIHADKQELNYERTAWLKILGVPLKLWDESNFSLIASRFGKVISPFDYISNRRDYSMGKVGVLTSEKKWINEEVTIKSNGMEYRVGVVEYTDDWSPFKPVPFDKVEESEDEEEEDVDGVSDTWMEEVEIEQEEEGEFRPNQSPNEKSKVHDPMAGEVTTEADELHKSPTKEQLGGNYETGNNEVVSPKNRESVEVPDNHISGTRIGDNSQLPKVQPFFPGPIETNTIGPIENLVPLGCFGPFPNNGGNYEFTFKAHKAHTSVSNVGTESNSGGPTPKKRKRDKLGFRNISHSPSPNFEQNITSTSQKSNTQVPPSTSNIRIPPNPVVMRSSPDIDYPERHTTKNGVDERDKMETHEFLQTVEIGSAVGFQIAADNPILAEVLGGIGEQKCNQ
ncbi:hypothetical protein L2E82_22275 [Cichorium intybus]|uniref:Uncharacterized protein n=1 Tax=Cichorium intybus TaxID=13427 RepID=A0ACB9DYB7_CICIN|nr:hypothetical protein L2E82_22275 [Cichorium intybus]